MSTFAGLDTAISALRAAQQGLDVTSQNLANATTPGYVRRRSDQMTSGSALTGSIMMPPPRSSGGVVAKTTRMADVVLDARKRYENGLSTAATESASALSKLENVFDEPSDTGLAARLDQLWNAFSDITNGGTPAGVLGAANLVTDWLHSASTAMAGQIGDAKTTLADTATQAQGVADALAKTNSALIAANNAGQDTADLEDLRDKYAEQLSTMLGATTTIGQGGAAEVSVNGTALVTDTVSQPLAVGSDGVSLTIGGAAANPPAGTAAAAITTATVTVPGYQAKLDAVAVALRDQVNARLSGAGAWTADGRPGTALFGGTGAGDLTVQITKPADVAVSSSGSAANTDLAATLSQQGLQSGAPDTVYRDLVSAVGNDSARAQALADTRVAATNSIQQARLSAEGVNTDEETMNLLTYQRNYQAASRVLTTLDQALDQLINHTGAVGL